MATKFKKGDKVRLSDYASKENKRYYTNTTFEVVSHGRTFYADPITYKVRAIDGEHKGDIIDYQGRYFNKVDEMITMTKKELEERKSYFERALAECEEKIRDIEEKIRFVEQNKLDGFDELQFRIYKSIRTIQDPNLSDIERVNAVVQLVKGNH